MLRPICLLISAFLGLSNPAAAIEIVALGDSLTAGLGVDAKDSFPAQLEAALRAKGHDVTVINAGVSGDTTSAALERLDWALVPEADAVIVALGANDALRGVDPKQTRASLDAILDAIGERKMPALVAGMLAPRNLGPDYAAAFDPIFGELSKAHGAVFYPFFLDGVAAVSEFNQADGMHPNARGVAAMVKGILPSVEELIRRTVRK
jgi:acyl-CoA thioesterase-1